MERAFTTHIIRNEEELSPVWTLTTPDKGGLKEPRKVVVPGVWESVPGLENYKGRAVYTQWVDCSGNMLFRFGGVGFRAKVRLDGKLIAEHYGAYTSFETVAKDLTEDYHKLEIEVDNRFGEDSALHIPNDYTSYGGITRPVTMAEVEEAYLSGLRIVPHKEEDGWYARVTVLIRGIEPGERVGLILYGCGRDVQINQTFGTDENSAVDLDLKFPDAVEWSPEHPEMSELTAVLTRDGEFIDDLTERFGFREISLRDKRIYVNGKPVFLKGFNRHEDFGDFGSAVPAQAMMRDLQLMKDMGANAVRTCHYPNDPLFLDLCDEMGFLVWEESHARGLNEEKMRHPNFMPQSLACAEEMVAQHINHPCILTWGCLNECSDDTEYGAQCYRTLFETLRDLDGSRPVTAALLERAGGKVYDAMDIVSVNIYPGWYHDTPVKDALNRKKTEIAAGGGGDKPLIVSEIGAGAVYGFHDPLGEAKWSEERQCAILRKQISGVMADPDCSGIFLWQFADVPVDESWAMGRPCTRNNKGVVDRYRRPKMAYAVVKKLFLGK